MNNYAFSPGVMIDPVTMNPIVRGGSITVNPMGMPVPVQQKPWLKFALMNIHEDMPDDLIKKLLNSLGKVVSFNRMQNQKTKIKSNYCLFQYSCGDDVVRANKFFRDVRVLDRTLDLKISEETKSFLKQWMTFQKQEWKKKLMATGMNEAKEYESLQVYLERDDKAIQDKLNNAIKEVNNDFRKYLQGKARDDERKQHPREKERDKKKRQLKDELDKKYSQKLDYWLTKQKQKDRQYKKEREREKDKQKAKRRRLEREINMDSQQQKKKISKFLNPDRKKQREKQLQQDLKKIQLQWLPPEPELLLGEIIAPQGPAPQGVDTVEFQQLQKNTYTVVQQQLIPETDPQLQHLMLLQSDTHEKKFQSSPKPNKLFTEEPMVIQKPKPVTLNLPPISEAQYKKNDDSSLQEQKRLKAEYLRIYKLVPKNKEDLWSYKINWDAFSKSMILDRKIRPWLFKACSKLMGEAEQNFISMIQKFIINRTAPDIMSKFLTQVIDKQAERFVMDLWIQLIFNMLKLENGLQL